MDGCKAASPVYKMTEADTRYPVFYKGTDVWKANKDHKTKYKSKKEGVKVKTDN